jgi:hypothetical protein
MVTKYGLYKPCPIPVLCHCIQEPWLVYNVSPHWLTKRDDLVISENILFSLRKDNLFVVSVEIALGEYRLQNCYNECLFPTVIKLQHFMLQVNLNNTWISTYFYNMYIYSYYLYSDHVQQAIYVYIFLLPIIRPCTTGHIQQNVHICYF